MIIARVNVQKTQIVEMACIVIQTLEMGTVRWDYEMANLVLQTGCVEVVEVLVVSMVTNIVRVNAQKTQIVEMACIVIKT